ncbi:MULTISPECIES: YbeD family protein [unclassified Nitrosomonas]|jgi:putative lipoic acid-binding regulatory protein|uniref:HP0495 family protein n=1 Tax=unclassified Nitrosomonas TaxID=2609265 RepID=UPI0008840471|nr:MULTISPECIES: DUF493 domain-containing protein [unclassified Nitrosomonas]SDI02009.1 hypothetical protein SAMN05428952_10609 [Nitrosomonas sp. Nm132]SDZ02048.1 hypothetical protein SAMN05421754_104318 [Nitrosomonas sp. Nm58]
MTEQPSFIEYPCDFPIKIMGRSQKGLTQTVLSIVKNHAPDFDDTTLEVRASKNGTYLSLTCTIWATSRAQLDALYQELHDHPMVMIVF